MRRFMKLAAATVISIILTGVRTGAATPQLSNNNPLYLDQGSNVVITAAYLAVSDAESPAGQITFTVGPESNGGPPHNGTLRLSGVILTNNSTFTQADIDAGRLTYEHNDSDTQSDDFQFKASDADRNEIPGPPFMTFSFRMVITPVNHPPVAGQGSGSTGYGVPFQGIMSATDREAAAQTLSFRIVTNGVKGMAVITDTNTGAFVYTPNAGERGVDTIRFQVNDGTLDSVEPGIFTISLGPMAFSGSYQVLEGAAYAGMLVGTNANPPHTLNYRILTNGTLGTVVITDTNTGAFTYTPGPGVNGADAFSFAVNDGYAESAPAACSVRIQPVVEPGDYFITEMKGGLLIYVDRKTSIPTMIAQGEHLRSPKGCVLSRTGDVVVADGAGGVVRVSLSDGGQSVVSAATNFSTGDFSLFAVAEEPGGAILVGDGPNGLLRVAPETGAVTPLARGENLLLTLGVAVATNGQIYVTDAGSLFDTNQYSKVVRIDPVSGAQTVISAGTNLALPVGIAVESPDTLVVTDAAGFIGGINRVLRIQVSTGAQSIVSEGGELAVPIGLGVDDDGKFVVVSQGGAKVLEVDPATGAQTVLIPAPSETVLMGLCVVRQEVLPDGDGDVLPDWWEQRYFPYRGAQAGDDPDRDSLDNTCEFKAGTNPTDPQSALKLTSRPVSTNGNTLEWGSVVSRHYTLERASVLSREPGVFTPLRTGIKATPPINRVVDAEAGAGNYFYRLRLEE